MMGYRNDYDHMLNLIEYIKGLIRGIGAEDVDYIKELLDLKMDELVVLVKTAKIKSYPDRSEEYYNDICDVMAYLFKSKDKCTKSDDPSSENHNPSKVTWDLQTDPIKIPEGVPVPINKNISPEELKDISDLLN